MHILVTGGAGFIGSHLCDALSSKHDVIAFDDMSVGDQNADVLRRNGVNVVKGSILDFAALEKAMKGCDVVFHLAAMNRAMRSVEDPLRANDVNVTGTLNCLEAAKRCGIGKFVFASSSSVYGNPGKKLLKEDMNVAPRHPYGANKAAAEMYANVYHDVYGLKTVVLRYFSVYGPRQRGDIPYAAVVPRFITQQLTGVPLTVYGSGLQRRNFTFVADNVAATIAAMEKGGAVGQTINVASEHESRVMDIVKVIGELTGREPEISRSPSPTGDVERNAPSVKRMIKVLGHRSRYSLKDGIKATMEWYGAKGDVAKAA